MIRPRFSNTGQRMEPLYTMNDGIVYIHDVEVTKSDLGRAIRTLTDNGQKYFFETLAIAMDDYTLAKNEEVQLTKRIRTLRRDHVNTKQFARIGSDTYAIWRVRQTINRQGVEVTDITLRAVREGDYDTQGI